MTTLINRMTVWCAPLVLLWVFALGAPPASAADPGVGRDIVAKLYSADELPALRIEYGLRLVERLGPRPIYLLRTPAGVSPDTVIPALRRDSRVAFAERNFAVFEPEARRRAVWAIGNAGAYEAQWAPQQLNLEDAHAVQTGTGVTVAVIDTGLDSTHPALAERVGPGYDFVDNDSDTAEGGVAGDPGFGHGTHVAGLIALTAPAAEILPVRALDRRGRGTIWTIAEAIFYAADPDGLPDTPDHARVINLSLGTLSQTDLLDKVVELVTCSDDDDDEADDNYSDPGFAQDLERCNLPGGSVVIAAAGNGASTTQLMYPAAERAEGALAVAANTSGNKIAAFSNRGSWVQIAAPGASITSTVPGGGYGVWSGTSMATALVSGLAALVIAGNPDWRPVDVTKRLQDRSAALCNTPLRRVDARGAVLDETPGETLCP
jgi:subtilisin family serine protease